MNFVLLCILTFVHDIGLVMETRSHGQSCRVEAVTTLILVLVEVLRGLDLRAGGGEGGIAGLARGTGGVILLS